MARGHGSALVAQAESDFTARRQQHVNSHLKRSLLELGDRQLNLGQRLAVGPVVRVAPFSSQSQQPNPLIQLRAVSSSPFRSRSTHCRLDPVPALFDPITPRRCASLPASRALEKFSMICAACWHGVGGSHGRSALQRQRQICKPPRNLRRCPKQRNHCCECRYCEAVFSRQTDGDKPVQRRNARVKLLLQEKPSRYVISLTLCCGEPR